MNRVNSQSGSCHDDSTINIVVSNNNAITVIYCYVTIL